MAKDKIIHAEFNIRLESIGLRVAAERSARATTRKRDKSRDLGCDQGCD